MDKTKKCTECGEVLPFSEFRKRGRNQRGVVQSWCNACTKAYQKAYYAIPANKERLRAYQKVYRSTSAGKAAKKRAVAKYRATPEGKATQKRYEAEYRAKYRTNPANKIKVRARDAVKYAVRVGKMERPTECSQADDTCAGRVEYHHEDYSKPLEVVALCTSHHKRRHIEMAELAK